jgi:hypothetical protein
VKSCFGSVFEFYTPLLFGEVKLLNLFICTLSPSRLTLINAYACIRVDLPDGTYTLTHEEEGAASGELNQVSVQQDLDQSPEEAKACVGAESEEGKHRFHLTHFIN